MEAKNGSPALCHFNAQQEITSVHYRLKSINQENRIQRACFLYDNSEEKSSYSSYLSCIEESVENEGSQNEGQPKKMPSYTFENNHSSSNLSAITPTANNTLQISCNPFEVKPESLQFLSCSPSVFTTFQKPDKKKKTFQWSIDQISMLEPAEIDETSQHDVGQPCLDADTEEKVQKAIETFFSQNHVVPSPWGALAKHVTFSPNLASTAYYTRFEQSLNNSQVYTNHKNAYTQTKITLPPDVDLMELLGPQYVYIEDADNCSDELANETCNEMDSPNNSSFRRKLFIHGSESTPTGPPQKSVSSVKLWSPPATLKPNAFQERSHICTPNSDQFSCSPVSPKNCSASMDIHTASPTVSPIGKSIFKTPSTSSRSEGIEILPDSSSSLRQLNSAGEKSLFSTSPMSSNSPYDILKENDTDEKCPTINIQNIPQKVTANHILETSVMNMSCDISLNNSHKAYSELATIDQKNDEGNIISSSCNEILSQEVKQRKFQLDSHPNSVTQDTGYQTGSLQPDNFISQSSLHHCLTNVVEITDSSNISMHCSLDGENTNILSGDIKDYIIANAREKMNRRDANDDSLNFHAVLGQDQCLTTGLNSLSWKPAQCSTPTKCDSKLL